jgi:DNA-binding GntR family transcriptional regulator
MMEAPKTSEEIAFDRLRHAVLRGELPVNQFLSQRMLAERIGAAVVTLRAAMRSLEKEGLLENVPHWGVRIPLETEESLTDRYYMREMLEVAALHRVLEFGDPALIEVLRGKAEKCDRMAFEDPNNIELFADLHFDFHHVLAEASKSALLLEALDRINLKTLMLHNASRGWGRGFARSTHVQLVSDLFSGDHKRAEDALARHVREGLELELEAVRGLKQPSGR